MTEGHPVCRKLGVGLLVVTIWLELYISYSSSCHHLNPRCTSKIPNIGILVPAYLRCPGQQLLNACCHRCCCCSGYRKCLLILCNDHLRAQTSNLDLWPLRSSCMSVMQVMVLHLYTKSEDCRPSCPENMANFCLSIYWPWPLTSWSLNGVTGHPYHGLPSCQFSACYVLLFFT